MEFRWELDIGNIGVLSEIVFKKNYNKKLITQINKLNEFNIMKKTQRLLLISILVVPAIILTVFLILIDVSIKEFSKWAIVIPILILISPFIFFFAQRSAKKAYDSPLVRQKNRFLTVWGVCIIFFAILLSICYYVNYDFFWVLLLTQFGFLISVFLLRFRLFFPKKKDAT